MASNSSEPDPKVINSIVDRLKKQGLFDKFRKECLADVDTKPAYLNLRHRTEVAVARFLSTQTWHPALNKNQLRDSLRKHINESSMMSSGIDRVVEQVVNPKIYRVFKPQIDRVVCEFLGIDPDERERQLKLKDEEQRRQRMQMECSYLPGGQQPFPPGTVTPDSSYGVGSSPVIPSLLDLRVPYMSQGSTHMESASPSSITPQMTVAGGSTAGGSTSVGGITYPPAAPYGFPAGMQYGYPTQTGVYPGVTQQGMLQYPLGYSATMPPGFASTIPQYPMATDVTVAPPQPLVAAPVEVSPVVVAETKDRKHAKKKKPEPLTVEELLNIPLPPKTHVLTKGKTEKKEELGRQSPVVTETKDDVKPKRETLTKQTEETKSAVVPVAPSVEKMEVEGQDVSSSSDVPETKPKHSEKVDRPKVKVEKVHEKGQSREGQRRARETHRYTNKTSDVKKPVDDGSGVSDSNDVKTETVKVELDEGSGKVSSQALSESTATPEGKGQEEAKEGDGESKVYHFVWDNIDAGCISDATVSSVHTSDLSSFDDGSDMTTRSSDEDLERKVIDDVKVKEAVAQEADVMSTKESGAAPVDIEVPAEVATVAPPRQKPRRLISLQYNYSDSEEEESREERKARIAHEIEERYLRRQQRRAELEAKKKEREDEKAVEREQRRQRRLAAAATAQRKEAIRDTKDEEKKEEKKEEEEGGGEAKPRKRGPYRTKEKRKEELREQKVKEMRMALRRQRTRNRRYTSDEFTTFFSGNKCMRSNESYTKIVDTSSDTYSVTRDVKSPPTPTQDEHFAYAGSHPSEEATHAPSSDQIPIYEVTTPHMSGLSIAKFVHMTRSKTKQLTLDTGDGGMESGMPYSDVSSDALSFSGSSVDSKTHHSPSEGRQDLTSLHVTASAVKGPDKSTGHSDGDTPLARVRRKSSGDRQSSDSRQKQCQSSDTSSTTSSVESTKANVQRYAIADLYKPHHVRNRSSRHSSPPPTQREPQVRPSATEPDKGQEKRKAPPIDEVDFGEAAKKSLQQISFGEAERRSKAIRQRFGQSARHEVRRASSSKSPGDRVERMPVREPVVPSGGTYWSARDEKYRDTLKSGSTHGSWQSTKSSSQDDDDDNSRSKGRPRSRSQSEWRTEETPAKSDRKKRKKKRRKTEDSSCSGSEEYSNVSRVSQSSSGGDDLDPYPARPPGECRTDEDEPRSGIQREEGETSDSDDDASVSDAADAQDVKYTSEDTGFVAENIYVSTQDMSGVTAGEVDVSQAADGTGSVECGMEVTVGSVDTSLSRLQPTSVTQTQELQLEQGEIQLEIWQGSSHWSLSVENVGASSQMAPSVEVISVQQPDSDVTAGVEGVTIVPEDNQMSYDETAISCVDGNTNKGQKRPQSPGSDGGSPVCAPAKRARSDSSGGASNEEVAIVVQTQGETTSAATPTVEATVEDTMCSPVVESEGFHIIENPPPPIEPEQKPSEDQGNIMADVPPSVSVSPDDVIPSVQAETVTDTRVFVGGDSLHGTVTHEDQTDASTDKLERRADMGQMSPSSQEVSAADAVETSSPAHDGTDKRVHAPEIDLENSPPTPERPGESVLTPEKPSTDKVLAPLKISPTVADGTLSQSPVDRSPDETSRELDEILLLDEMTPPKVVTDMTAVTVGASEGEELPPQSPGSVSLCGEEQQQSALVDVTEARPDVSPTDASIKDSDNVAPEAAGNEEVVCETIESSPCRNEGKSPVVEDMEMSSFHEDTEETAESARPTAVVVVSETPKSEVDSREVDNELSDSAETGKCEHDSDVLRGEKDSMPDPPSPSVVGDGEQGSLQVTDNAATLDDSVVASKATLGNCPDASVPDSVDSVAEVQTAEEPCIEEESHQEQEADHEEEHVATDDVKATSNDAKSVEDAGTSPCTRVSDGDVTEASARGTETSDKKEDTQEVSDTETSTPSVSPETQHVEAKSAEPKQDDKESRDTGRRKSRRSVAEQQKDVETSDGDKSQPRQRSRDRSQSMSGTPRETRGQRASVTPPEGSTREPRKLRRPSTPPLTRSRLPSARSTGSGQPQQARSSSVGRKPGKVVTPPQKVVTPPKGKKGKAGNTLMTRASRRKSEEASLPIAKRLRH